MGLISDCSLISPLWPSVWAITSLGWSPSFYPWSSVDISSYIDTVFYNKSQIMSVLCLHSPRSSLTDRRMQGPSMVCRVTCGLALGFFSHFISYPHAHVTWASLLVLECAEPDSASGPLPLLFLLPGMLWPQVAKGLLPYFILSLLILAKKTLVTIL
jgi:hypothetical protein